MEEQKKYVATRPQYEAMALEAKQAFLTVADEKTWNKEIVFALQIIRGSETLQKCDMQSIKNSVVNIALTGATLNPALAQAYLIPRKGKCCLDFSYRGLCKIAVDSDSVYDIDASAVFEGDDFDYELGLTPYLKHRPKMTDAKREVVAAYAIATLHHGIKKFVVVDKEKIERAKKSSQTGNVWKEHYDEMAKKTAVKLLYKLLPQTERMSTAISVVNEHEGIERPEKPISNANKLIERFSDLPANPGPVIPDCPKGGMALAEICATCPDKNAECPDSGKEKAP
jgi:recombination protein RecT